MAGTQQHGPAGKAGRRTHTAQRGIFHRLFQGAWLPPGLPSPQVKSFPVVVIAGKQLIPRIPGQHHGHLFPGQGTDQIGGQDRGVAQWLPEPVQHDRFRAKVPGHRLRIGPQQMILQPQMTGHCGGDGRFVGCGIIKSNGVRLHIRGAFRRGEGADQRGIDASGQKKAQRDV